MIASSAVVAADPLVAELRHRLAIARVGEANVYLPADAPNAYLSANWETKMARLGRLVQRCDHQALALSVELLNTTNLEALGGLVYSLELAMGRCPERLLPIVPSAHIQSLCAVDAYAEEHPTLKLAAELDRRVARLRKAGPLAATQKVIACMDAYAAARRALQ